jgi:hypothetical protein
MRSFLIFISLMAGLGFSPLAEACIVFSGTGSTPGFGTKIGNGRGCSTSELGGAAALLLF